MTAKDYAKAQHQWTLGYSVDILYISTFNYLLKVHIKISKSSRSIQNHVIKCCKTMSLNKCLNLDPTGFPTEFPTRFPTAFPTEFPTEFPAAFPARFPAEYPERFPMQGLFVPFACVGSGDPVRVLHLLHIEYTGYT